MDSTAVNAIRDLAVEAAEANRIHSDIPAIVLGDKVISLEQFNAGRSRFRGVFRTPLMSAFIGYTNANAEDNEDLAPTVFVDAEKESARAVINAYVVNKADGSLVPGHCDHNAILELRKSAPYAALVARCDGKQELTQRNAIEFVEDWAHLVTMPIVDGEGNETTAPAGRLIAAIRSMTVKAVEESQTTVQNHGGRVSSMAQIEVSSAAATALPERFYFLCAPYQGFSERVFQIRVVARNNGDKPVLVLSIVSVDEVKESIAAEFEMLLRSGLDTPKITIGTFDSRS
ncbi:MAG: DUF2303 family protein [Flavobacteriales bacterium]|nr:DUF2303 family protein [Flavobacteriales bacterium]